jgi:hypothetical protein
MITRADKSTGLEICTTGSGALFCVDMAYLRKNEIFEEENCKDRAELGNSIGRLLKRDKNGVYNI